MRVLVLYLKLRHHRDRNTVDEHLYSFRRFVPGVHFHYFNAANGIPRYLTLARYDGVILHYSFLSARWVREFFAVWQKYIRRLTRIPGYKVAIPQDEYAETAVLWEIFRRYDVRTVFTCFPDGESEKAYPPEEVPRVERIHVLPGYVDETAAEQLGSCFLENRERPIDLSYRARRLPYWLGRHGQLKHEIGQVFLDRTRGANLCVDISTDEQDVFIGGAWYEFLCRSRAVLGCEGGASLMDPTGAVRTRVERYVTERPEATFEEVERMCFPGQDGNIRLFTLSPRHFECALTRTCQVLIEGDYGGIFQPGVHYIEVKRDYSNLDEVLERLRDRAYCARTAENAYRDIVGSGKYSYRVFATKVIDHIRQKRDPTSKGSCWAKTYFALLGGYLALREWAEPVLVKVLYGWFLLKMHRFGILKKLWTKMTQPERK